MTLTLENIKAEINGLGWGPSRILKEALSWLEQTEARLARLEEIPPSSLATSPQEATPPGPNTLPAMSYRARVETPGYMTHVTVTFHALSSTLTRGDVRRFLQAADWTEVTPTTLEPPWLSGATQSATPVAPEDGHIVGGSGMYREAQL